MEEVLDISRIVRGQLRLDLQVVDVRAVIERALDTARPAASAKGLTLDATPLRRRRDRRRRRTAAAGRVEPAVERRQVHAARRTCDRERPHGRRRTLAIDVRDTGVGIPAEFLPHVFERFTQADSSTTRRYGGLGLGLAIVRHIVELHGGTVAVESAGEGAGSRFTITLPVRAAVVRSTPPPAATPHECRAPGRSCRRSRASRVLVVDDEQDARDVLAGDSHRRRCGGPVASSAQEALELMAGVDAGRADQRHRDGGRGWLRVHPRRCARWRRACGARAGDCADGATAIPPIARTRSPPGSISTWPSRSCRRSSSPWSPACSGAHGGRNGSPSEAEARRVRPDSAGRRVGAARRFGAGARGRSRPHASRRQDVSRCARRRPRSSGFSSQGLRGSSPGPAGRRRCNPRRRRDAARGCSDAGELHEMQAVVSASRTSVSSAATRRVASCARASAKVAHGEHREALAREPLATARRAPTDRLRRARRSDGPRPALSRSSKASISRRPPLAESRRVSAPFCVTFGALCRLPRRSVLARRACRRSHACRDRAQPRHHGRPPGPCASAGGA